MKIVEIQNNPIDSYLALGIVNGFFIVENKPNILCRFSSIEDCRKGYMVEKQPKKDIPNTNKGEIIETRPFKLYLDKI